MARHQTSSLAPPDTHLDSRRSYLIFALAVGVYVIAILQRSSFGVAGVAASERFDAGASIVSIFVVVQLLTYSGMQIPAGLLADRFGSRVMLGTGAAIMALGQLQLAFAESLTAAIIARVMVGMGDAMTFTSVIKLLPAWFTPRRIPMLVQSITMFGQLGQLLSSIPLAYILRQYGWTTAFAAASACGAVACVTAWAFLRTRPPGNGAGGPAMLRQESFVDTVRAVWTNPGTRLGFFLHAMAGYPGLVFSMMWGYPFLEHGVGLSAGQIGLLFTLLVLGGLVFGPIAGLVAPRHPLRYSNVSLAVTALNVAVLVLVISFPQPPFWVLVVWMIALSTCAAGSNIGFEVARARNSLTRIGTATGVVIMGAFSFSVLSMWLVGLVLDHFGTFSMHAWRWAWASLLLVWALAMLGVYRERGKVRAEMASEGVVVPRWPDAIERERRRRRERRISDPSPLDNELNGHED